LRRGWIWARAQRAVDALLRPYAAAGMECYPVSTAVNNVRNEGGGVCPAH
jgi:putative SOS response-associated peptidase YedK